MAENSECDYRIVVVCVDSSPQAEWAFDCLRVNIGKTKILRKNTRAGNSITINDQPLQELDDFTYLGSNIATDGDCTREVVTRISRANQTFAMLKPIWRTRNLSVDTKIRIFKSNVLSVVLYGSECWKSTANIERKLEVFQTKCLRRIMRIFWPNMISNKELRHRAVASTSSEIIATGRWRWLGHVCRMPTDSVPRVALRWTPQGKKNRGRPKETWRRTVERDLKTRGLTLQTSPATAADRSKWCSIAVASSTRRGERVDDD